MSEAIYDYGYAFSRPSGCISLQKEYDYLEGSVSTKHGYVICYAQGDENCSHITTIRFIHEGRMYVRTFNKRYSKRGIVTKANQFVTEIVGDTNGK